MCFTYPVVPLLLAAATVADDDDDDDEHDAGGSDDGDERPETETKHLRHGVLQRTTRHLQQTQSHVQSKVILFRLIIVTTIKKADGCAMLLGACFSSVWHSGPSESFVPERECSVWFVSAASRLQRSYECIYSVFRPWKVLFYLLHGGNRGIDYRTWNER